MEKGFGTKLSLGRLECPVNSWELKNEDHKIQGNWKQYQPRTLFLKNACRLGKQDEVQTAMSLYDFTQTQTKSLQ